MKLVKLQGANTGRALFINTENLTVVRIEQTMDGSSYVVVATEHGSHRVKGDQADVAKSLVNSKLVQLTERDSNQPIFVNPDKVTVVKAEPVPANEQETMTIIATVNGSYPVSGTISDAVKKLENTGITS